MIDVTKFNARVIIELVNWALLIRQLEEINEREAPQGKWTFCRECFNPASAATALRQLVTQITDTFQHPLQSVSNRAPRTSHYAVLLTREWSNSNFLPNGGIS